MPQMQPFAGTSSNCQVLDQRGRGENVTDLNAAVQVSNVSQKLRTASGSNCFEQNLAALNHGIQLHVLLFPVEPSAAGAENNSRNAGFGEKRSVRPRSHSDELLCSGWSEDLLDCIADELHDRRLSLDFVCWTRAEPAHRGMKILVASREPRDEAAQFDFEHTRGFFRQHSALQLQTALRGIARKFLAAANHRSVKRTMAEKRMRGK